MSILLIAAGLIPFALGGLMNRFMMNSPDTLPPYILIGVITLLLWAGIAFLAKPRIKSTKKIVINLNIIGFIVLTLLAVQELILNRYWPNAVGTWTQFYYLPLLNIGFKLTDWSHRVFTAYCAAFLIMVAASWAGCKLRKT